MLPRDVLLQIYRRMLRIRAFETRLEELLAAGELPEGVSLSHAGEATAAGACSALSEEDIVVNTSSPHACLLARDVPMDSLMAELFGRVTGLHRGRAGPLHTAAFDRAVFDGRDEEGAGLPLAAGAALAVQRRGSGQVVLARFGDEVAGSGALHDAISLAVSLSLPAIFLCECRGEDSSPRPDIGREDVAGLAESDGLPTVSVDGSDVLAVFAAVEEAALRAREGGGSSCVLARSDRWGASSPLQAVDSEPVELADAADSTERDPIERFLVYLFTHGVADGAEIARIAQEVDRELAEAVDAARSSPPPPPEEALADVYADATTDDGRPTTDEGDAS